MQTQTVTIEWNEGSPKEAGEYLMLFEDGHITQRYFTSLDLVDSEYDFGKITSWANPIEYKPDAVDTVQLLEQAVRELSGLIHLFNIRAKKERDKSSLDDAELLDYQTVSELEQLAEKLKINKLEQWR